MCLSLGVTNESEFLSTHVPRLLNNFILSYYRDDTCVEYFLYSKKKQKQISKNLIVSHEIFSHSLYVSKFYPELYKELQCKYLSAACFYMISHHAIRLFQLKDNCDVNLEARLHVFERFYAKLKEFNFKICYNRPSDHVYVKGHYHAFPFSTEMITSQTIG